VSLTKLSLPAHVLHLLHEEGVRDLDDWRRLGRRRLQIFGVTSRMVALLDAAATEARTS
jgi:hypothetical protein